MADELAGKVVIVTGGASGIGRAAVELFVREGAQVTIADVDAPKGEQLAATLGPPVAFKRTDVADAEAVQALIDFTVRRFGSLDVMLNNAGIPGMPRGRISDDDFQDFQKVMAIDLYGVMIGTQRAALHMAKNRGGAIVNIGSVAGSYPGFGQASYRAAKAAVNHFTKCAAIEYGDFGIRVNCINPSAVPTEMLGAETAAFLAASQPLKRLASPLDVANVALFLASARSAQVTGQAIAVDGGHSIGDSVNYVDRMIEAHSRAAASTSS